jgi:hypothetical protein
MVCTVTKITLLIIAVSGIIVSCSSNDVDSFLTERKTVADEMAKSLTAGDYNAARTTFDSKKAALKSKCQAAKSKVTDAKKWAETQLNDSLALTQAISRAGEKTANDIPTLEKMMALVSEHSGICN